MQDVPAQAGKAVPGFQLTALSSALEQTWLLYVSKVFILCFSFKNVAAFFMVIIVIFLKKKKLQKIYKRIPAPRSNRKCSWTMRAAEPEPAGPVA